MSGKPRSSDAVRIRMESMQHPRNVNHAHKHANGMYQINYYTTIVTTLDQFSLLPNQKQSVLLQCQIVVVMNFYLETSCINFSV